MGFASAPRTCQLISPCLIIIAQRQESRDMCLTHNNYFIGHLVVRGSDDLLSKGFYTLDSSLAPNYLCFLISKALDSVQR